MKKDTSISIVILHGWSYSIEKWSPFINCLKQSPYTVTLLKIPGLTDTIDRPWTLQDYSNWLGNKLEDIPSKRIVLIGHSFGGQISAYYSAHHPQSVYKLILIDSSGLRVHSMFADGKRLLFYTLAKLGKLVFKSNAFRKILYSLAREKDYYNAPPVMKQTMHNVISQEIDNELKLIKTPTLIIWGEKDQTTPISLGKKFHALIEHSALHTIPEARHAPHFQFPTEVAEFVLKYI